MCSEYRPQQTSAVSTGGIAEEPLTLTFSNLCPFKTRRLLSVCKVITKCYWERWIHALELQACGCKCVGNGVSMCCTSFIISFTVKVMYLWENFAFIVAPWLMLSVVFWQNSLLKGKLSCLYSLFTACFAGAFAIVSLTCIDALNIWYYLSYFISFSVINGARSPYCNVCFPFISKPIFCLEIGCCHHSLSNEREFDWILSWIRCQPSLTTNQQPSLPKAGKKAS